MYYLASQYIPKYLLLIDMHYSILLQKFQELLHDSIEDSYNRFIIPLPAMIALVIFHDFHHFHLIHYLMFNLISLVIYL